MTGELRHLRINARSTASRDVYYRDGTSDHACIEQIFKRHHYSTKLFSRNSELLEFVQRRSADGKRPLIVDAGANIGASAVSFGMDHPGARIAAIEPETENFDLLRKNTEGLDIECLNAGLSSSHGRLKVSNPSGRAWAFRTEPADKAGIPRVTIPDIYERECVSGTAFPFIVKIDIEGAEADVFAANTGWLAQAPVVIIELHDWLFPKRGTAAGFLKCIADQPRDFLPVGENIFSIAHDLG